MGQTAATDKKGAALGEYTHRKSHLDRVTEKM